MPDRELIKEGFVGPEEWSRMLEAATTKEGESGGHRYLVLGKLKKDGVMIGYEPEEGLKTKKYLSKMSLTKIAEFSEKMIKASSSQKAGEIKSSLEAIAKSSSAKLHSTASKCKRFCIAFFTLGIGLLYTNKVVAQKEAEIQSLRRVIQQPHTTVETFLDDVRALQPSNELKTERKEYLQRELIKETKLNNIDDNGVTALLKTDNERTGLAIRLINKHTNEVIEIPERGPNETGEEHIKKIVEALNRFAPGEQNKRMRETMQVCLTRNVAGNTAASNVRTLGSQLRAKFGNTPPEELLPHLNDKGATVELVIDNEGDNKINQVSVTATVDYDIGVQSRVTNALNMPTGHVFQAVASYTLAEQKSKEDGVDETEPQVENFDLHYQMRETEPMDPQLVAGYQKYMDGLQQEIKINPKFLQLQNELSEVESKLKNKRLSQEERETAEARRVSLELEIQQTDRFLKEDFFKKLKPGLEADLMGARETADGGIYFARFINEVRKGGSHISIIIDSRPQRVLEFVPSESDREFEDKFNKFFADHFPGQNGVKLLTMALLTKRTDPAVGLAYAVKEKKLVQTDLNGKTHQPEAVTAQGKYIALHITPNENEAIIEVEINSHVQVMDSQEGEEPSEGVSVGTLLAQTKFGVESKLNGQGWLNGDLKVVPGEFLVSAVSHLVSA